MSIAPHALYPYVYVFPDLDALSHEAADRLCAVAREAVQERGVFHIALSGGSTPARLYRLLAEPPRSLQVPWENTHVFWGDERCVPPDHPDSNFLLANTALLSKIDIPPGNVHRVHTNEDPQHAAVFYEQEILDVIDPGSSRFPRFDMILLGMGDDGHTASLFPNGAELSEQARTAIATSKPGGWDRVTLSLPAVNAARHVLFLAAGAAKAPLLARALHSPTPDVPASMVRPTDGTLAWLVDREAAAQLD